MATLFEFFRECYVPDRFPQPSQRATREAMECDLRKFERWIADTTGRVATLDDLSDTQLKGAMAREVAAGRSVATANRLYRHVKALWALAHDRDLVAKRCRTKPYREYKREPEAWQQHELVSLVRAATQIEGRVGEVPASDFVPALLLTIASTGARISAVMQAPTAGLDLASRQLRLPAEVQKQRADQLFDLLPSAAVYIARLNPRPRRLPTLFADWPHDRSVISWPTLNKLLRRVIVAAGLRESVDQVTRRDLFHKLRKTFATSVAARASAEVARDLLGHSSLDVTKRYIDRSKIGRPNILDLIDDPLGGAA